jgi:hypothetical protein
LIWINWFTKKTDRVQCLNGWAIDHPFGQSVLVFIFSLSIDGNSKLRLLPSCPKKLGCTVDLLAIEAVNYDKSRPCLPIIRVFFWPIGHWKLHGLCHALAVSNPLWQCVWHPMKNQVVLVCLCFLCSRWWADGLKWFLVLLAHGKTSFVLF